ncbi:MAG: thiamine phosphate synthase [Myxococcales bacterium]|nr:thiamine phosphate synthase [Myxococcales bacterium]
MPGITALRGLYAIVDPEHCGGRDPLWVAERVLAGGCALLQLRDKRGEPAATRALATALHERCRSAGVPFVLNDFPALAAELGADGLHLGQDDAPIAEVRITVGSMAIGLSTHSPEQAARAADQGADLIGFGPVFDTRTKHNPDATVGLSTLRRVVAASPIPVVAIGGITEANAPQVAATGTALAAVISALCQAPDPAQAAQALHTHWTGVATTA